MRYNKELLERFINETVAIATRTQKEYDDFMEMLEKETDLMWWMSEEKPTSIKSCWSEYKENTTVTAGFLDDGLIGYSSEEFYKQHGYEIVEYKDLIKGDKGMTTNEFIKRVKGLGYEIEPTSGTAIEIILQGKTLTIVDKRESYRLDTLWYEEMTPVLFDLLVEYARTPIEEREEEPKYYWKVKGLGSLLAESEKYLNYVDGVTPLLYTKEEVDEYKTKFTKKEFKEVCEKYNITAEFSEEEIGE